MPCLAVVPFRRFSCLSIVIFTSSLSWSLTVDQALRVVVVNALEREGFELQAQKLKAMASQLDSAYDWQWQASSTWIRDKLASQQSFIDESTAFLFGTSIKRQTRLGTKFSLGLDYRLFDAKFVSNFHK